MENLRKYGTNPFSITVIHGGPGAPGEVAPVARELSSVFGVLEPFQTAKTINGQVKELTDVLQKSGHLPVTLIGWSWGAWLSFIFAAKYPLFVKKIIFIGSGAFEEKYAENIMKVRLSRLTKDERAKVFRLNKKLEDSNNIHKNIHMTRLGEIFFKTDSYDPISHKSEIIECQYDIYQKIWEQATRLRSGGKLLEFGKKINCPVVAIHGDYDPHLYQGVKNPLSNVLKDFKFKLLKKCGHYPWFERYARDEFFNILKNEIV